ncbi:MAG TPA: hypothetical protein VK714_07810 [Myxococcota bacterium]|nr:hypothetical protein [Myxococcota bacterium]
MPRKCSVCARADRELVEAALDNGGSFREIRRRFGVALGTIHRHVKHTQRAAVRILEEAPEKCGESVLANRSRRAADSGPAWSPRPDDFSPAAHSQRRLLEARRRVRIP